MQLRWCCFILWFLGSFLGRAQDSISVSKNPTVNSIYARAIQLSYEERFAEALPFFDQVIALDPLVSEIYLDRGIIKTRIGDQTGAIADFTLQLALTPRLADAYFLRGERYLQLHNYQSAWHDFKKVNRLDAGNADAYCFCAEAAQALHKVRQARKAAARCAYIKSQNN
ncbi:MAG: hypothetical protein RI948_1015 [Bacteroidota bacterium]|jgi:tetratricopeptide (TPR) repeat protein